ncbi:MAG: DinB family protein [Anaerolineales bacterium]
MPLHSLIAQLRFSRSEFVRGLKDVSEVDAVRRLVPMNCLRWLVGHLADHEHYFWVILAQQKNVAPGLFYLAGYGQPASTPALKEMWATWQKVTATADEYLDTLTAETMQSHLVRDGRPEEENVGTLLMRTIYHYWYHTGEASAIRQMLGHTHLPEFVGNMTTTSYRPEEC